MSSSSSEAAAPANIRVLVRVRPFDREARSSHLEIEDGGMTSAIDFGMGDTTSSTANTTSSSSSATIHGSMHKESKGTIYLVDQSSGAGGGYGSGYDSGANNSNYAASSSSSSRSFTYDAVFGPQSKQSQIFDSIKGIVDAVCAGYNGTIVAYGQTGSGKTYTIFGEDGLQDDDNAGLVQRSLKSIFDKISEQSVITPTAIENGVGGGVASIRTTTKASFFEIYNERVYDLLSPNEHMTDDDKGLLVREDATKGVYVEGLAEVEVSDTTEAMDVLRCGLDNRRVASTKMNRVSSRSHALFVLTVKSELFSENGISKVRMSKFTLVDLAGSERQKTTAADGDRLKEACNINNSLLCLGQVINALVDREKGKLNHVAFRNTNLTFLLRDSFGGNSKTCLVATVSPSYVSLTETVSTLKFAQRAKLIKNTAVLNENTCGSVADLQSEIARLRAELELKHVSVQPVKSVDQPMNDRGLPPLAPRPNADTEKPANNIIVSALRNQNSMLTKKVKVLKDVSSQREMQVNLLKRKVQQETLIRKCKERRITYLSSKGKTSGIEDNDEVAALCEEIAVLQEQVHAQPHDPVEWILKYKEERTKVEEMEANAAITFGSNEKTEMEASLVLLLDERDSLQQKVKEMSNERNVEIDAIINDVTTLENSNVMLQSQLYEKMSTIKANEKKIQSDAAHIEDLQQELKTTLDRLEISQKELEAGMQKTLELQESVDRIKIEVSEANEAVAVHQCKVEVAHNELETTTKLHDEALAAMNTKLGDLQTNLNDAMKENESLMQKLQVLSDDLQSKVVQMDSLELAKNEALQQLEVSRTKNDADMESFKLREEALMVEIDEMKTGFESVLAEKTQSIESVNAQNASLLAEVEDLKTQLNSLQRRVESTVPLHDIVATLEDEIILATIEAKHASEQRIFKEADLERTIRLQDHLNETQLADLSDELAINEGNVIHLSREKTSVQTELTNVSQQLLKKTNEFEDKISSLESDNAVLRENVSILEADQENAEVLRKEHAHTVLHLEQRTNQNHTLMAEMDEMKVGFESSLAEKTQSIESVNVQNASLSSEVENMKTRLTSLQRNVDSIDPLRDVIATLEDEIILTNIEAKHASVQRIFNEADLQRTIRLQVHLHETQLADLSDELAINEVKIKCLSREKSDTQMALTIVSQQLLEKTHEFEDKISSLESDNSTLRESASMLEADQENAEVLRKEHAQTVLLLEQHTNQNHTLMAEMDEMKVGFESSLAEKTQSIESVNVQNASLSSEVEEMKTQLNSLQRHVDSTSSLHDVIATLEDDITLANIEAKQASVQRIFNEADLQRTIRLQVHLHETQLADLSDELAINEVKIDCLSREKSDMQVELANVSRQLVNQYDELKDKISSLENENSMLRDTVRTLEAEQENSDDLQKEHDQTVKLLEQHNNQNHTLSAAIEALTREREDLQQASQAKITNLEMDLSNVVGSHNTLKEQLMKVSDELGAKTTQLQTLEEERDEGLRQLSLLQEQHNAGNELFKQQEQSMAADVSKANETIESLLTGKALVAADLEKAVLRGTCLTNEVEMLKSQVTSLQKQCDTVFTLDAEVARVTTEKDEVQARFIASEAKIEQLAAALDAAHSNDGKLTILLKEKEDIQKEMDDLSKEFAEKERAMGRQIEMLVNEVAIMKEERSSKVHNENELLSKLDSMKEVNASLVAQLADSNEKISEFESANESSRNEWKKSQAECERLNTEVQINVERVNELEVLLENANASCKELSEKIATMSADNETPADLKSMEEGVVEAVNEQFIEMPSLENPPDWESSPINHINNPLTDSTFCADDTFDESMFLPNVQEEVKSPLADENNSPPTFLPNVQEEPKSPQTDENKSPPTPLTSNKRVLFAPAGDDSNVKFAAKSATPVQRMTRSMRNKVRTPLGESTVQNASSTTRKGRTKKQIN